MKKNVIIVLIVCALGAFLWTLSMNLSAIQKSDEIKIDTTELCRVKIDTAELCKVKIDTTELPRIKIDFSKSKKIEEKLNFLKYRISIVQKNLSKSVEKYSNLKNSRDTGNLESTYQTVHLLSIQITKMNSLYENYLKEYNQSLDSVHTKLLIQHKNITKN